MDSFSEFGYRNFVYDLPLTDDQRKEAEKVVRKCSDEINRSPDKIDLATGCNKIPIDAIVCAEKVFRTLPNRS